MSHHNFVHIGTPKTGSTALQICLDKNRELLKQHGFFYPEPPESSGGSHKFLAYYTTPKITFTFSADKKKQLKAEVDHFKSQIEGSADKIIVSSEWFYGSNPKHVSRLFPKGDTKIIIYIRDQINYLVSYYQEMVGYLAISDSLDDFGKNARNLNFSKRIDRWAKVFGSENIEVRLYDRARMHKGNIVDDFLHILDPKIDVAKFRGAREDKNPSIGGDLLSFKRHLNAILNDSSVQHQKLRRVFKTLSAQMQEYQIKPMFSPEVERALKQKYYASNQAVFSKYFQTDEHLFDYETRGEYVSHDVDGDKFRRILEQIKLKDEQAYCYIMDEIYACIGSKDDALLRRIKTFLSFL